MLSLSKHGRYDGTKRRTHGGCRRGRDLVGRGLVPRERTDGIAHGFIRFVHVPALVLGCGCVLLRCQTNRLRHQKYILRSSGDLSCGSLLDASRLKPIDASRSDFFRLHGNAYYAGIRGVGPGALVLQLERIGQAAFVRLDLDPTVGSASSQPTSASMPRTNSLIKHLVPSASTASSDLLFGCLVAVGVRHGNGSRRLGAPSQAWLDRG